jgi:hypothetical protein
MGDPEPLIKVNLDSLLAETAAKQKEYREAEEKKQEERLKRNEGVKPAPATEEQMRRTYLSCDRCGRMDAFDGQTGVTEDVILIRTTAGQRRSEHQLLYKLDGASKSVRRDLCRQCIEELEIKTAEIWMSTKPEAVKLKEVK